MVGSGRIMFDFGKSFVKDFGDVEKIDYVIVFVVNGLYGL